MGTPALHKPFFQHVRFKPNSFESAIAFAPIDMKKAPHLITIMYPSFSCATSSSFAML